jgi:hypothetical protein
MVSVSCMDCHQKCATIRASSLTHPLNAVLPLGIAHKCVGRDAKSRFVTLAHPLPEMLRTTTRRSAAASQALLQRIYLPLSSSCSSSFLVRHGICRHADKHRLQPRHFFFHTFIFFFSFLYSYYSVLFCCFACPALLWHPRKCPEESQPEEKKEDTIRNHKCAQDHLTE